MNLFHTGFTEIGRKLHRQANRLRLKIAQNRREKALTQLGLLGWQQADFDPETERQVDEIQNVEREQSRHINAAAEFAREIRQLVSQREAAQREHAENKKGLEGDLRRANEAKAQIDRQVAERRKVEPNFERRIPELDRELREVNKLYSELLMQERQTPKMKQELIRLRERSVAIPNEKSDLRTQHLRAVTEVRTLEESAAKQSEATAAANQRIQYANAQWDAKDGKLAAEIKAREKEKMAAERQLASLESAKSNPYLRIGEVLANSGIAPVNQPETLAAVRKVDVDIALLEGDLTDSLSQTAQVDPATLRLALPLCIVLVIVALLFIYWIV